jgi:hypothetical protein
MPETPVNKDSQPRFGEYEIRFSKQLLLSPPAGDAISPEDLY